MKSARQGMCLVAAGLLALAAAPTRGQSFPYTPPRIVEPHIRAPLTSAVAGVAQANNQFAFDLFAQLGSDQPAGGNMLVSPLSISTALAMTYAGARGQTAQQMADVFHWTGLGDAEVRTGFGQYLADLNAPREGYELSVANRLFGQQNYAFKQNFLDQLAGDFAAPVEELDFVHEPDASRVHINEWVEDRTHDRIQDLLPDGSVTSDTRLVLANAVYFNADWKHQFDKDSTRDQLFHRSSTDALLAPTMYQQATFGYGEFDDFQMLEMPYAGDDLSMVIVLPREVDGLAALEATLTADALAASVNSLTTQQVRVSLPRFEMNGAASLAAPLIALGMTDAFGDADFTGMAEDDLAISDVFHKTFLKLDEAGTEAAAATAVVVVVTSLPPSAPEFRADHPFLFALRDRHTGALLFLGRMADPGAAAPTDARPVPEPVSVAGLGAALGALIALRRRRSG